ncbi:hypothetical protein ACFQX4_26010 [Roseomonas sp. GCM10028921]
MTAKGFLAMGGQIIDATLIAAPRQKLTLEEKAIIRDGGTPEGWSRAKQAQKDRDARWTLKRGRAKPKPEGAQRQAIQIAVPVFDYKSHIGIDQRHGLIRRWTVTDAAQHGSRSFPALLDPGNTASRVWGGHGLPHQTQSGDPGTPRSKRTYSDPQANPARAFRAAGQSQCLACADPLRHRACFRCAEVPHGAVRSENKRVLVDELRALLPVAEPAH